MRKKLGKNIEEKSSCVQRPNKEKRVQGFVNLPRLRVKDWTVSDIIMLSIGGYEPVRGFMGRADYESVLENWRLSSGEVWSIPITLSATREKVKEFEEGSDILLVNEDDEALAVLRVKERYGYDKQKEAKLIYGTTDEKHPGVKWLYSQGEMLLGGEIVELIKEYEPPEWLKQYWLKPAQTRQLFTERGWRYIVGFQTRNPLHRAHEYIIKCALEICDGLLLHPIFGQTKEDDVPAEVRLSCYQVLIENYFPPGRVVLAINPSAMRYAGPREAIFHACIRRNYGCTHFIVGRDHAGVGSYYEPFAAHKIFERFSAEDLGITPLFFDNTFWCQRCEGMASRKTCPHPETDHLSLSGTKLKEMLHSGENIPIEISRPEVVNILRNWMKGED